MNNNFRSLFINIVVSMLFLLALYLAVNSIWFLLGIDWRETFYPAARAVLNGQSPFIVPTFRNVPWAILFILPFAILRENSGGVLYFMASLAAYGWVAYRLRARPLAFAAFLFSPPVVYGLRMLNVDVLILIGFVLPAPIGLFFVLIKPQMGIGMAFYWLAESWREGGIKSVVRTFAPVTISLGLSFLLFGNWLAGGQIDLLVSTWNASFWPWGLPIGIVLVALAIRDRRKDFGMAASPFLSPYLAYHSWAGVLVGLLHHDFQIVLAVIGMWLAGAIHGFGL